MLKPTAPPPAGRRLSLGADHPMYTFADFVEALSSPTASERNAAAVVLMDLADPRAIQPLVAAIEHPSNLNARGTLVYALSVFDCSGRFGQLFRWALEGGYEASGESLSIIREQGLRPTEKECALCKEALAVAEVNSGIDAALKEELMNFLREGDG